MKGEVNFYPPEALYPYSALVCLLPDRLLASVGFINLRFFAFPFVVGQVTDFTAAIFWERTCEKLKKLAKVIQVRWRRLLLTRFERFSRLTFSF